MAKILDLGSFNPPEELNDDYKTTEDICEICDHDYNQDSVICIECCNY